ncbi:MAG: S1/P1 nuclease [Bacteroidota bacterium]|nr:S1/P1 nuclease [Bacteroidota bacterium]
MKISKLFLTSCFLGLTLSLSAYDAVGHRIIADIAYNNLTNSAKGKVDKVLGKRGMVYEATWADEVRSDNRYAYSYQWHFQDLDDNMTSADLKKLWDNPTAEGQHLFFAIDSMIVRLKKDKNDTEALKFLVHFVGDLHQPMHLGRKDDKGGNKVDFNWFGRKTNLHAVWDGALIDSEKMSYSEFSRYLQDKYEPRKAEFKKYGLLQSIEASYAVRESIYRYDTTDTSNYHYVYFFADKRDEMLYRGGIQLANILNTIYK